MRAEQEQLTVADDDVAFLDLNAACAHAFDFPAFQGNPGLDSLFEVVIEFGLLVQGNGIAVIRFFLLAGHFWRLPRVV